MSTPVVERFWSKVDVRGENDCWPWIAGRAAGNYGRIYVGDELPGPIVWNAPRVSYWLAHGTIDLSLQVDHVCHTLDRTCPAGSECLHRACVNPAHLELVTHQENHIRRGSRLAACPKGHPYTPDNVGRNGVGTRCKRCHREAEMLRRAARRSA